LRVFIRAGNELQAARLIGHLARKPRVSHSTGRPRGEARWWRARPRQTGIAEHRDR